LTVKAVPPSGDIEGIAAIDAAGVATNVSATGQVTSTSGYGIVAINGATTLSPIATPTFTVSAGNATDLNVNAASVFCGLYGIYTQNFGTGTTHITTSWLAQGGIDAIDATSGAGQAIALNGTTENAFSRMTDLAVKTTGGTTSLVNNGTLNGVVKLGDLGNQMTNSGLWLTADDIGNFDAGANTLVNASGDTIVAAASPSQSDFVNRGTLSLRDGGIGGVAHFIGNANLQAGSVQAIDANRAGQSDKVMVDGSASLNGATIAVGAALPPAYHGLAALPKRETRRKQGCWHERDKDPR
jgi:hypothetical protein